MTTMKGSDNHDKKDAPKGEKYARRAKVRRKDWCLPRRYVAQPSAFLLMAETTVASVVIVVGNRADDDHPGISVAATMPQTTMMTMSWLRSWWGLENRNNVAAPVINGGIFRFGLSPL
jgi:hypothetical protein